MFSVLNIVLISCLWSTFHSGYVHTSFSSREIIKREANKATCLLPEPLAHGRYRPHARRCPAGTQSEECRLVPGTSVPARWVLYYSCDPEYQLNTSARASLCSDGLWVPALPACVPAVQLVSREGWGAQTAPQFPSQEIPLRRVIIAHTATSPCDTRSDCVLAVQSVDQYHTQQFGDIGYNFLVGGDGSVFEGQGWGHLGAHTYGYNTGSVCIALIGNFVTSKASEAMMAATKKLIEYGISAGKIANDYKLNAHCQLIQIASPGREVFNVIRHWPNWDSVNALRCTQ